MVSAIYAFVAKAHARDEDMNLLTENMDSHKLDKKTRKKVFGYVKVVGHLPNIRGLTFSHQIRDQNIFLRFFVS